MPELAINKKARFDYEILETFEGGLVLTGAEVKSSKGGSIQIKGAFVQIRGGEVWLKNAFIAKYKPAGDQEDYDANKNRKVLLHKKEIKRLMGKLDTKGLSLVPLRVYTKFGRVKIEIALVRGKKKYEKRESIKNRDIDRRLRDRMKE